jgi:HAD superfamily hydrolase (TIGR01549 family)
VSTQPHRAWLLDLDGTLYRALPVKAAMALELSVAGWSAVSVLRRFRGEHEAVRHAARASQSPFHLQIARTAEATDLPEEDVFHLVQEWMFERPSKYLRTFRRKRLVDEIRTHRAGGGLTALVSDYPARRKLEALGVAELFDVVVASGEPGGPERLKPDPCGYLAAASRLDVSPEGCLVIGDRDDADGAAARGAGMSFRKI